MNEPSTEWQPLRIEHASALTAARLALHHAAQLPAAAGASRLPPEEDFSHTALSWSPAHRALVTGPLPTNQRVGLRMRSLTLAVIEADGSSPNELPLIGQTRAQALEWLAAALGGPALTAPEHDLPAHPVADGDAFEAIAPEALEEVEAWLANGHLELSRLAATDPRWSAVRCWPHHFDIATLMALDSTGDPEADRSIGAGLSLGDGGYAFPYVYVTPWPYPKTDALPELPSPGRWHTEGWVGAVLPSPALETDTAAQTLQAFLSGAVSAAAALLSP